MCVFVNSFYEYRKVIGCFVSHRFSQMNRGLSANRESTQRDSGPSPFPNWPLPLPLPRREGRNHRDTPIRRTKASCCPLLVSTIAETLCVLCMPKAFCGLKTCAKMLCKLCGLCERKNSPATFKHPFSYSGCVLFLTE